MQRVGTVDRSIQNGIVIAALAGVISLAGCDRPPQQGPPPAAGPPEVTVVTMQPEKVTLTTELPGRTSAFRVAEIRPQVSGLIMKRLFEEGSDVKAGQLLYQIDPAPFQAALDNANAALSRVEANLPPILSRADRYKNLLTDKAVSQQDYDDTAAAIKQIQAEIESWKAQVKIARINLQYTNISAPIGGRIGRSSVTMGAIVTAYQPLALATIQQLDPIYVDVPQSTKDLLRLKNRLKNGLLNQQGKDQNMVKLTLEDDTEYPLTGTLQFSDITVDPTTGSVTLRAIFANPEGILLPGMFVHALIKEGINEQAILVPQQGVARDPKGNPFTLVVDDEGKAGYRPLTLDRAIGSKWMISAGLAPGDRVIVEGLLMLRPGTVVNATPFVHLPASQGSAVSSDLLARKRSEGGV